jgi:hypothetical protein
MSLCHFFFGSRKRAEPKLDVYMGMTAGELTQLRWMDWDDQQGFIN